MHFTGLSFALLALLAHVGVQAAPFQHSVRAVESDPDCHSNSARSLSLYARGSRVEEIVIAQIIDIQSKNKKKDKKKDNKRIDAYKNKNKDKNTIIIVVTVIEIIDNNSRYDKDDKSNKDKSGYKSGNKTENHMVGGMSHHNNTKNGTAGHNVIGTMYAVHTLMADVGAPASAGNEMVQVYDYQTTMVAPSSVQATGTAPVSASTGPAASDNHTILSAGSPPPSQANVQPDPANPAVTAQ